MPRTTPDAHSLGTTRGWTYLTNHAHVLICLARDPECRLRDVADQIGITERSVQNIVHDLVEEGVLEKIRVGRRNHYRIRGNLHLRHPMEASSRVADLLQMANPGSRGLSAD